MNEEATKKVAMQKKLRYNVHKSLESITEAIENVKMPYDKAIAIHYEIRTLKEAIKKCIEGHYRNILK